MAKDSFGYGREPMMAIEGHQSNFNDGDIKNIHEKISNTSAKQFSNLVKNSGYGESDIGYSMMALKIAKDNNIIDKWMRPIDVKNRLRELDMDPHGFIVDEDMLKEIFKNG
jgi:hypothetical protein